MKKVFNVICSFVKAHTAAVITSTAVVAAIGVGVGGFALVRSLRQNNDSPVFEDNHKHVYSSEHVPATCSHGDYTLYTCSCGDFYKEDESAPLDHKFGEWEVVLAATADNEGKKEQCCLYCNEKKTEIIPKIGAHEHAFKDTVVKPTCTVRGYTAHTCTICGTSTSDNEVAATGHSWTDWRVTKQATTNTSGEKKRTCQTCGETETEGIPKVASPNHTHSYTSSVMEATCTAGGYTRYVCSCGHSYDADQTPARGHLYGNWETTVQPSTSSAGEKQCVCSRCGNVNKESIPQLDPVVSEKHESYIDSRIEIKNFNGTPSYCYGAVRAVDARSWGDSPSISIMDNGGFFITYFKRDGSKVEVTLAPVDGYVHRCVLLDDGSYTFSLIGDYKD